MIEVLKYLAGVGVAFVTIVITGLAIIAVRGLIKERK